MRGELKIRTTQIGADSLAAGVAVTLEGEGIAETMRVRAVRMHQRRMLLALHAVDDATAAPGLVGRRITIAREAVRLGPGEHLDDELIGCAIVDAAGNELGAVVDIAHYPAHDMLVVGDARSLVPLVRAFIVSIDTAARRIVADLPPGLLDDRLAAEDRPG